MKVERTTVSLPADLMQVAQDHCDAEHLKFSNLVEKQLRAHLTAVGKLPADEVALTMVQVRELIATRGVDVVQAKLNELAETAAAEAIAS